MREDGIVDIAKKLQIKARQAVFVEHAPEGFVLDLPEAAHRADTADADAVLVLVINSSELVNWVQT